MFDGMQLKQPLTKLPLRFCAETLAAEVRSLPLEAWIPHPSPASPAANRGWEGLAKKALEDAGVSSLL